MSHYSLLSTKKLSPNALQRLQQKGVRVECIDFITTKNIITEDEKTIINALAQQKIYVIFTSANAVQYVAEALQFQPKWNVFCISGKTKSTIEKIFTKVTITDVAENATTLAEKILQHSTIKNILHFSGTMRLNTLQQMLAEKVNLQEIFVYQTTCMPQKVNRNYNGILFFSPSAVRSFYTCNNTKADTKLFAIGTTTAAALTSRVGHIMLSEYPSEDAIVQKVLNIFYPETA